MNSKMQWITADNIRILFFDYRNLKNDDFHELIQDAHRLYDTLTPGEELFIIADVTGLERGSKPEVTAAFKTLAEKRAQFKGNDAIIGLNGPKRIIANIIRRNMYFAKDFDDAVNHIKTNNSVTI